MTQTQSKRVDVFIIGGGISGAAVAAECSRRGLAVMLCDKGDVGGASSSQSDQILPGAMHFLRSHNLPYFNKVIKEKALLKQSAPHLFRERAFVIVPVPGQNRSPISRIWLWLFQNWLQHGQRSNLSKRHADSQQLAPLRTGTDSPWVMEESMVDDARLVIENLIVAQQERGEICPHLEFVSATREKGQWRIQLLDSQGEEHCILSRCLVNAAGMRVNLVQAHIDNSETRCWIELKRKLFLVIPKFYQGDHAYVLETAASPIYITPYQEHFCLVSTVMGVSTQTEATPPTEDEQRQIIGLLNQRFNIQLDHDAARKSYCIQQPVYSDDYNSQPEEVEDYALDLNCTDGRSPLISIFGGSFATHRAMAEEAVEMLGQYINLNDHPASRSPLPGGELKPVAFDQFILHVASRFPWLPSRLLNHYCRTYGARALQLLDSCQSMDDLGSAICPGLHEREVSFLLRNEWVSTAEDVLWRRTRLGLEATAEDTRQLQNWIEEHLRSPTSEQAYTMWSNAVTPGRLH